MASRWGCCIGIVAGIGIGVAAWAPAWAEDDALKPIPAAECQKFASQMQDATGIPMKASEDDFSDINNGDDGRSCHIAGSASDKTFANPDEVIEKIDKIFAGWHEDPERADSGPDGADDGYTKDNRLAVLGVSWEPGPGITCSDKEPLSACKITPQQKLWTATADIVVVAKARK
ncbi:MAG: hypothetical protein WB697_13640 [Stellaceae bacterium]